MSRWETSLHPSWDRMYAAGMTVQEIADFTGRARSTVHRHLQVRETYSTDLRVVHEAALAARDPGWPNTNWRHNYKSVQDFHAQHGRLPQTGGRSSDAKLAQWIGRQRSLHRVGKLPALKVILMDVLPGWHVSPKQLTADAHWFERLDLLQAFVAERGRLPRYKRHTTERERVLGVWLHAQHQARAEGRLLSWREVELDTALPGWHSTM